MRVFLFKKLKTILLLAGALQMSASVPIHGSNNHTLLTPRADEITVKGKIVDANRAPVNGAIVQVRGTSIVAISNAAGEFSITVSKNDVLVISSLGFADKEIVVADDSFLNIQLETSSRVLDEMIVVGYTQQKKSLVTGAISSIKAEDIASVSSTRVEQALQGRSPGIMVLPASGSPGNSIKVRIRGTGSNGNADPLYIVDGIRTGGIEYLDPYEIASVEVLKDAASSAIYGAEGGNGVVLITTKGGRKNNPGEINFSAQVVQQSVGHKMKMMNPQQYADYLTASKTPNSPTPADVAGVGGTTWFDEIFQTAPLQRYTLNFTQGTEKTTVLLSGTIFSQDGIVGGDKASFDRYTGRFNYETKIKPWLTAGTRVSYSHFSRKGITEDSEFGGVINNALMMDPVTPVIYTSTPYPTHVQNAINAGHPLVKDENGNYYGISPYIFGEVSNPIAQMAITHSTTTQNKVVGNGYIEIEPVSGLKLTSRYGIDAAFQRTHGWNPTYWFSSERLNTSPNTFDKNDNWLNTQWENFLTYNRRFGDHNVTLLVGTSALKRSWNYLNGTASGMFSEDDRFSYPDFEPDDQDKVSGLSTTSTLASYYGRIGYDFKNRYLFNVTVRRDGSSLLAPGHQWGSFPSVSAGWVASNEEFLSNVSAINYMKIRASWGQNGSLSNLGVGQYLSAIGPQGLYPDANGNFLTGAGPSSINNPDLTWETSEQLDIGADFGFFKNNLLFTVDYFNKLTKDLITPGRPPIFAGNVLPFTNGGNVRNKGWEFELSYQDKTSSGFKYEIGFNLTTLKNEVTYLNPVVKEIAGSNVGTGWSATAFKEGFPIWYFRGYKTDGIFQDQQQIDQYIAKTGITGYTPKPGDPIILDINGDKLISVADHTMIGSPHPDLLYGGRISLGYKGFDFLVFIQGQSGNDILMGFNRGDRATANKPEFFYTDRWTGPGSTNTWFAPNTNSEYVYNSDLMIFDGSFARIRQLQLGYNFSSSLLNKIKFKNARIYVSLDDFFTFTKYPGLDPEAGSNNVNSLGIDRGVYPVPRKMILGVNFTF